MANHCIDVICLVCGREWCARGCGNAREAQPDPARVEEWHAKNREWAAMWGKPLPKEDPLETERCCGVRRVVIW